MDASDTTYARKSKAQYISAVRQFVQAQPAADCAARHCSSYTTCVVQFPSYEERQTFKDGRKNCGS